MPWKRSTTMSNKLLFIEKAMQPRVNMQKLCTEFGITRKTGYALKKRYLEEGEKALEPLSRQPHSCPHRTTETVENIILATRDKHPKWGGVKIQSYLLKQGYAMPSVKTVNRILKRHGRVCIEESLKRKAFIRFEHEHPNDLWQMDFKGNFKLTDGKRCHPLTLLDDHSRFSLGIRACSHETIDTVKIELERIFRTYGLPKRMTMDNGTPWGYSGNQKHTRLTAWLIKQGITVSHSRPYHPQTQGKLERFHRTLKLELLEEYNFSDFNNAQEGFDWWREMYNEDRPHEAIGLAVPSERYKVSELEYIENPKAYVYDSHLEVRKVGQKGNISYKGHRYTIGEAFSGHYIGLKATSEDGIFDVYFCHQKVIKINLTAPLKY